MNKPKLFLIVIVSIFLFLPSAYSLTIIHEIEDSDGFALQMDAEENYGYTMNRTGPAYGETDAVQGNLLFDINGPTFSHLVGTISTPSVTNTTSESRGQARASFNNSQQGRLPSNNFQGTGFNSAGVMGSGGGGSGSIGSGGSGSIGNSFVQGVPDDVFKKSVGSGLINSNLLTVGSIQRPGGTTPDTAPVPEPATMLLLGTGLIGIAGFKKFMKKR